MVKVILRGIDVTYDSSPATKYIVSVDGEISETNGNHNQFFNISPALEPTLEIDFSLKFKEVDDTIRQAIVNFIQTRYDQILDPKDIYIPFSN